MADVVIRGGQVIDANGSGNKDVLVSGGRIVATLVGSEITKEAIAERSLGALAA